jgi:hypothetical protein
MEFKSNLLKKTFEEMADVLINIKFNYYGADPETTVRDILFGDIFESIKYKRDFLDVKLILIKDGNIVIPAIDNKRSYQFKKSFIRKYRDLLDWYNISQYQILTEENIIEFSEYVKWWHISEYQKLSYDFIKNNLNKIEFEFLCYNRFLTGRILNLFPNAELHNMPNYTHIKLSNKFIRENLERLDLEKVLLYNKHLNENTKMLIKLKLL